MAANLDSSTYELSNSQVNITSRSSCVPQCEKTSKLATELATSDEVAQKLRQAAHILANGAIRAALKQQREKYSSTPQEPAADLSTD